jgi:hypothetical protein
MPMLSIAALAVALGTGLGMYIFGRQYSRRYIELHRRLPPATWLFRRQEDPLLEGPRRRSLALLPILSIAAALYVINV